MINIEENDINDLKKILFSRARVSDDNKYTVD